MEPGAAGYSTVNESPNLSLRSGTTMTTDADSFLSVATLPCRHFLSANVINVGKFSPLFLLELRAGCWLAWFCLGSAPLFTSVPVHTVTILSRGERHSNNVWCEKHNTVFLFSNNSGSSVILPINWIVMSIQRSCSILSCLLGWLVVKQSRLLHWAVYAQPCQVEANPPNVATKTHPVSVHACEGWMNTWLKLPI